MAEKQEAVLRRTRGETVKAVRRGTGVPMTRLADGRGGVPMESRAALHEGPGDGREEAGGGQALGREGRMRGRRIRFGILLLWLAVAAVSQGAAAQELERSDAPIRVSVPRWVAAGAVVPISGTSVPVGGRNQVTLTITRPSGQPVTLSAPVTGTGAFAATFKGTSTTGLYRVRAVAPDGKASADASFSVLAPTGMGELAAQKGSSLLAAMANGLPVLEGRVAVLPPSPAREEAKSRLKAVGSTLQRGPGEMSRFQTLLKPVGELPMNSPAFGMALEPAFESMAQAAEEAEAAQAQLEERLRIWGSTKPTRCDDVDAAVAGLDFYAGVLQLLTSSWKQIAVDVAEKTVMDRLNLIPTPQVSPEDVMAAKGVLKAAEAGLTAGREGFLEESKGLTASTAAWFAEKFLGVYCERFQGTVDAHFGAQYFAYGKKWWAYNIDLTGKVTLRYQKGTGDGPVQVSGEFEGNAGNFKVWEDLMVATPAMRQYVLFHLALPPPPPPPGQKEAANEFGKIGRAFAGPYSFLVPVHGIIEGDQLILEVDPAKQDYGSLVKGQVWYVMVDSASPTPIPYLMKTDLPMVKAQFILSRGTRGKPSFPIVVRGGVASIERTFTREEADAKGNYKVVWRVTIKACNPKCP